ALVDLGRIEQVEDGEVLHGQNSVHTFEAEAALLVEKIGDVSLPEAGLLGEPESGQFACLDSFPQYLAKIFLQDFEFHSGSIASDFGAARLAWSLRRQLFHHRVRRENPLRTQRKLWSSSFFFASFADFLCVLCG